MLYLLLVSLLWAFSFGLIKTSLAGINPILISVIRLTFSLLVFLPFLRIKKIPSRNWLQFTIIGAIQFGLMYVFYNFSFQFLKAYEVALFTIFTPIFVILVNSMMVKKFDWIFGLASILAVIGTAIIVQLGFNRPGMLNGFLLVQASNICFAVGQVFYKKVIAPLHGITDQSIFAALYAGGVAITAIISLFSVNWSTVTINANQWITLAYLGAVSSGLGFFLWNFGARRANIGTLAVFNDLKIPLSITVSLLVFGEKASVLNLIIGGGIILIALVISELHERRNKKQLLQRYIATGS